MEFYEELDMSNTDNTCDYVDDDCSTICDCFDGCACDYDTSDYDDSED